MQFKINNIECPCMNCGERQIGCHSNCEPYLNYDNKCKALRKTRTNNKNFEREINSTKNFLKKY